ncbi:hypothetical protein [Legionella hackeliae]|uniref:Uncharacterized protein n=1 Tax=Legionella hackeliae TaxID=449 RepID=A0A0A8USI8_LEGHA|nr:hypothetical protein [Legionella hackeliae]KTD10233.1 hypothetical protein Lhac_2601 [Legionella hackeliae]CEK09729.1 protein of unknown function [Legionella hackeliae]STX49638.1 Uncharacterised protein [Legionella hackeliae]
MYRLLSKNPGIQIPSFRNYSVSLKEFSLANLSAHKGKILRVSLADKNQVQSCYEDIYQEIILPHKNSLFIGTIPTVRYSKDYLQTIYPGHNFSFITDNMGKVSASVSKRPDTNKPIAVQKRINDKRLESFPAVFNLYEPHYTSLPEDLKKWLERAKLVSGCCLFFQIFPLAPELGLSPHKYKANVNGLLQDKIPYSLFSWIHPTDAERIIRASNCNSAIQKAIFGEDIHEVQDMFCQEAAMTIGRELAKSAEYEKAVEFLQLNQGIEKSSLTSENYLPIFTA